MKGHNLGRLCGREDFSCVMGFCRKRAEAKTRKHEHLPLKVISAHALATEFLYFSVLKIVHKNGDDEKREKRKGT